VLFLLLYLLLFDAKFSALAQINFRKVYIIYLSLFRAKVIPVLPGQGYAALADGYAVDSLLGTLPLAQEAPLAIAQIFNIGLVGALIHAQDIHGTVIYTDFTPVA
jgi:hypothetical protein